MGRALCQRCGAKISEFDLRCGGCGEARPADSDTGEASWQGGGPALAVPSIPGYRVVGLLGRGSMGLVYRAEDLRSGATVALKTVAVPDAGLLPRIRREVHALSRLRHPGIVRILDSGAADGVPWYAMRLVDGVTLRHWATSDAPEAGNGASAGSDWWTVASGVPDTASIPAGAESSRSGRTTRRKPARTGAGLLSLRTGSGGPGLGQILTLARRLCAPLAYLHGEGLVHRDLKPDNVLVAAGDTPVLVDFGLVSQSGGDISREALEAGGTVAGTVA